MPLLHPRQFRRAAPPGMLWHGTPDERTWDNGNAHYGVHVGTKQAGEEALHARIGRPAEGNWRGDREYGKTLLNRNQNRSVFHPHGDRPGGSWTHEVDEREPSLPSGKATYSGGKTVPADARPSIFPVRLKGPMTNTPATPHPDFHANGYMAGQLKRGRAKSGYYYTNVSEDEGSISAVVPSSAHLERLDPKPQFGRVSRYRRS